MSGKQADDRMFEILVREHHRRVLAYVLSLVRREDVAEDIVQDSFLTAYRKLADFDPSRDFGNWVRGIARLKYLEWTRRQQEVPLDEEMLSVIESRHQHWDGAIAEGRTEVLEALQRCLQNLQDIAQKTVDLFYMRKQSCAEIGQQMGATEPVVRKRLERARQLLLQCVNKRMETPS